MLLSDVANCELGNGIPPAGSISGKRVLLSTAVLRRIGRIPGLSISSLFSSRRARLLVTSRFPETADVPLRRRAGRSSATHRSLNAPSNRDPCSASNVECHAYSHASSSTAALSSGSHRLELNCFRGLNCLRRSPVNCEAKIGLRKSYDRNFFRHTSYPT
jgi:hypothetical protein